MAPRKKKTTVAQSISMEDALQLVRYHVRFFYDMQGLRIASGNRHSRTKIELDADSLEFLDRMSGGMNAMERELEKEIERYITHVPVYHWLVAQRGIATVMAGMLLAYTDATHEKCGTVSKLWSYCGLAVIDGQAQRRRKGEKATFNPWLKSKVLYVLGGNLLRAAGLEPGVGYYYHGRTANPDYDAKAIKPAEAKDMELPALWVRHGHEPTLEEIRKLGLPPWEKSVALRRAFAPGEIVWRSFYDNYKARKLNTRVPQCMGCLGTGAFKLSVKEKERVQGLRERRNLTAEEQGELDTLILAEGRTCKNCGGRGVDAPWGRSDAHRHNAALRYVTKMFLASFWEEWRKSVGLPVRPMYHEEKLGHVHNAMQ